MTKQEFINYYVERREQKAMIDSLGEMYDTVVAPLQNRVEDMENKPCYTKDEVIIRLRNELVRTNIALGIGDPKLAGLTATDMQYIETLHTVLK